MQKNRGRTLIDFLGVKIDVLDTQGLLEQAVSLVQSETPQKIMYVNTDCMLLALKNQTYKQVLNNADLVYADGIGVVWGARIWGELLPGRSTGADFMPVFCETFGKLGLRIYLLGAKEGVAADAAERLQQRVSGLQIVGTQHGYFSPQESGAIIDQINRSKPHILLVGMGAPRQELWINEHLSELKTPVVWGVGGLFDFLSGRTRRGPRWLLDNGFEWLCRLLVEPRRLWRRYLIGNSMFIMTVLWHRFFGGKKRNDS